MNDTLPSVRHFLEDIAQVYGTPAPLDILEFNPTPKQLERIQEIQAKKDLTSKDIIEISCIVGGCLMPKFTGKEKAFLEETKAILLTAPPEMQIARMAWAIGITESRLTDLLRELSDPVRVNIQNAYRDIERMIRAKH